MGVVIAMVRNPGTWGAGPVKTSEKNEDLFDDGIQFDGAMRQSAMVSDRCAQSTGTCD
jgi:hypothetical protein